MRKKHFTRQLAVIISEETYNQVIEETNRNEVAVSEWIREAIQIRLTRGQIESDPHTH